MWGPYKYQWYKTGTLLCFVDKQGITAAVLEMYLAQFLFESLQRIFLENVSLATNLRFDILERKSGNLIMIFSVPLSSSYIVGFSINSQISNISKNISN